MRAVRQGINARSPSIGDWLYTCFEGGARRPQSGLLPLFFGREILKRRAYDAAASGGSFWAPEPVWRRQGLRGGPDLKVSYDTIHVLG